MTWFDKNFKRRMPVMINTSLTGSGSVQAQLFIPLTWDDFWDNVRTDGFDVVITDENAAPLAFQRESTGVNAWNKTNRIGLFRFNYGAVKAANVMHIAYIYYDHASQSSDLSSTVGVSSPLSASVYLGAPFKNIVNLDSNQGLTTTPTTIIQKDPDDIMDIWFPISQILAPRSLPYNERLDFKSVNYINVNVLNSAGANQAGLYALQETRIIAGWISVRVQTGTKDVDYVVRLNVYTNDLEVFTLTCLLQVRQLLPS